MSVLRPLDKLPELNTATILLVSTEDALLQQLADSMLREDCASQLNVHLARSLPLPSSVTRPRIDLIVFVVNLHSKYSLQNVEESLCHVDASFFLGKVCFLATGGGKLPGYHGAAPGADAAAAVSLCVKWRLFCLPCQVVRTGCNDKVRYLRLCYSLCFFFLHLLCCVIS
ncbi:centromere protein M isoform X2 [Elephas maximus indicus]|uniref:centromere protein M isoform X2 n=1 Tax=Elephas maximus indicus TaxID=99487 RepID=UPI002116F59D|nr:centromere protein M isoform X2 [Elephas maximus indicus]